MHKPILVLILILSLMPLLPSAHAGDLSLLLNGKAIHLDEPPGSDLNEANWGLGLQYEWSEKGRDWIPYVTASGFIDSVNNPSFYAGGGYLRRWQLNKTWHADAGWIAFLMTRQDFNDGQPFPGILPVFSFGTDHIALNATYIPKVDPKMVSLLFFQLKIKLSN